MVHPPYHPGYGTPPYRPGYGTPPYRPGRHIHRPGRLEEGLRRGYRSPPVLGKRGSAQRLSLSSGVEEGALRRGYRSPPVLREKALCRGYRSPPVLGGKGSAQRLSLSSGVREGGYIPTMVYRLPTPLGIYASPTHPGYTRLLTSLTDVPR